MEATFIVTFLALAQYTLFGIQSAQTRGKHGLKAPAQTGHPEYERMNRVHLNTAEQLIMFLPALWAFGIGGGDHGVCGPAGGGGPWGGGQAGGNQDRAA